MFKKLFRIAKKLAPIAILYGPQAVKIIKDATRKPR